MRDYRTLQIDQTGIHSAVLTQVLWGSAWDNLRFEPAPDSVPEPASLILIVTGLAGLWAARHRA
jgi:hypothetical protein